MPWCWRHRFYSLGEHSIVVTRLLYTGADDGLRLTLNVEQYEYMPGPHDAAGVKMLLHTKGDVPRVHALGQAVPTGTHVFVGVKTVLVTISNTKVS